MTQEAREILEEAESGTPGEQHPAVAIAGMCSCVGEKQRALTLLEKAYEERSAYLSSLKVERWFDNIRSEPGFVSLLSKMGLG